MTTTSEIEIRITKLERDDEGLWKCNVTYKGATYPVNAQSGSWLYEDKGGTIREVMPWVAKAIQEKVRPIEKKERIAREKAADAA